MLMVVMVSFANFLCFVLVHVFHTHKKYTFAEDSKSLDGMETTDDVEDQQEK